MPSEADSTRGMISRGIHAVKLDYLYRDNAAADQYGPTAAFFFATRWLNVQVPDRLAAADDIRLKGKCEIVLGGCYLVGNLPLDGVACRQFAIRRRRT